jgi:hypothetical protein
MTFKFDQFLERAHADQWTGSGKDQMVADFERWRDGLDAAEVMELAEKLSTIRKNAPYPLPGVTPATITDQ